MVGRLAFKIPGLNNQTNVTTTAQILNSGNGGTGLSSATAYAVLCAGTTDNQPWQSIASVGTANQVLTSNGASALPTFQGMYLSQRVSNQTGAVATGTTTVPFDDNVPQNTAGTQFMSQAITPSNTANILVIEWLIMCAGSVSSGVMGSFLFQDATAAALAATQHDNYATGSGLARIMHGVHIMSAGTISATTFKVRAGMFDAGTFTFNGAASARTLGGVNGSFMQILEYSS